MRGMAVPGVVLGLAWVVAAASPVRPAGPPPDEAVKAAFGKQGIRITDGEAKAIRDDVRLALAEARAHGIGNSKVDFAAVEIATALGLDTSPGSNAVRNVVAAVRHLFDHGYTGASPVRVTPAVLPEWKGYFDRALGLWSDRPFMSLVQQKGFHPVKISWEDIGRYEGSVWGDRISDVGIWVREQEADPSSARLALSVRRDSNFRDKVLMVPASATGPAKDEQKAGLVRVALGHGGPEGAYSASAGYRGAPAEEPIRVTVVYFVTPLGEVRQKDMEGFAAAFARWDTQAIWAGSFVTKKTSLTEAKELIGACSGPALLPRSQRPSAKTYQVEPSLISVT